MPTTPHPTQSPHLNRILFAIQAELAPLLASGQAARLTVNVSSGGHVRLEVARFRDVG
jgi:hypothetical protein